MTVCIAAACTEKPGNMAIILCTDWRVGGSIGSAETRHKQLHLSKGWFCLTAGNATEINAVVRILRIHFDNENAIDETNIVKTVRAALNERKAELANEYTQGRYALSYSDFLLFGKEKLPADIFHHAVEAIAKLSIRVELIIAGFVDGLPIMLEADEWCGVAVKDEFAVVGEGTLLATAALLQRGHWDIRSLGKAAYCVFEAKKYAERVSSVGKSTLMSVLRPNGTRKSIQHVGYDYLNKKFDELGPQPLPEPDESFDETYLYE